MRRVLLVIEDYSELVFLETLLRKLGLDVLSIQNDGAVSEKILEFRPELIVATARGRRVNGLKLGPKLKRQRGLPHFILLAQGPVSNEELTAAQADAVLPSPMQPREFVSRMATVVGLDLAAFQEKFDKLGLFDTETATSDKGLSKSNASAGKSEEPSKLIHWKEGRRLDVAVAEKLAEKKAKKTAELLAALPAPAQQSLPRKRVVEQVKEFRRRTNDPQIVDIDQKRQEFVKALYTDGALKNTKGKKR
jgi:DNA-binding response OmpR family regulator